MTKIQEKTKQNQSAFWILVHKALDKNDGQIFCLPVVVWAKATIMTTPVTPVLLLFMRGGLSESEVGGV